MNLIETLPLPQRLAMAYAPRRLRAAAIALFAFDAHLANLVGKAREPLLGQMRLAWWRDRLAEPPELRPQGDPVLDALAEWAGQETALTALVDGWEQLLGDVLDAGAATAFAEGRAAAFAGLAERADAAAEPAAVAGRRWALADLAAHLGRGDERETALAAARALPPGTAALPHRLRPLAVLDGLARRSLARGGAPLADGALSGMVALRLGIFGR